MYVHIVCLNPYLKQYGWQLKHGTPRPRLGSGPGAADRNSSLANIIRAYEYLSVGYHVVRAAAAV